MQTSGLVLVLGYAGATNRALDMYKTKLWQPLGMEVIMFTHPVPMYVISGREDRRQCLRVLEQLHQKLQQQRAEKHLPIIIMHAFSNNGAWAFAALHHLSKSEPYCARYGHVFEALKVVIYDSAPALWTTNKILETAEVLTKPLVYNVTKKNTEHFIYTPLIKMTLVVLLSAARTIGYQNFSTVFCERFSKAAPQVPALFLYSTADNILLSEWVENVAKQRNHPGDRLVQFHDSKHCRHFYKNSARYTEEVRCFLKQHIPEYEIPQQAHNLLQSKL